MPPPSAAAAAVVSEPVLPEGQVEAPSNNMESFTLTTYQRRDSLGQRMNTHSQPS